MPDNDAFLDAAFFKEAGDRDTNGCETKEVDLLAKKPAGVIFAKTRGFDEGDPLKFSGVFSGGGDGCWQHKWFVCGFKGLDGLPGIGLLQVLMN